MSTKVEKNVVVDVPLSTVYNQWTQFEDFPHFMNGVQSVTQLGADRLQWVAELGGVRRQWEAKIVEQVPDSRVSWAATEGATNAGTVTFRDAGNGRTEVHLVLEYEPEGLVEKVGDKLNVVENQAEGDLERFKKFIEAEGYATGAWRGSVNEGAPVGGAAEPAGQPVTAPSEAERTSLTYLPSTPPSYCGRRGAQPLRRRASSSASTSRSRERAARSTRIRSPSRRNATGPASTASGAMWPMHRPVVPPENRPSVSSRTSLPSPAPLIAPVMASISRMPGPPLGPS